MWLASFSFQMLQLYIETIPSGVTKAEISLARSVSGTCQNPLSKSNLVTYLARPILSMQSSIRGIGIVQQNGERIVGFVVKAPNLVQL